MNKLEHSNFDHCIKKTDLRQSPKQISPFLTHQFSADTLLYGKFIARNNMFYWLNAGTSKRQDLSFYFLSVYIESWLESVSKPIIEPRREKTGRRVSDQV